MVFFSDTGLQDGRSKYSSGRDHDHVCHVFQCQTRILPDPARGFGGSVAYMIQMVVVYLGLGVIVQNSTIVFNTIKWEGVVYLVALGFRNWRQSVRDMEMPHTRPARLPGQTVFLGVCHRDVQPEIRAGVNGVVSPVYPAGSLHGSFCDSGGQFFRHPGQQRPGLCPVRCPGIQMAAAKNLARIQNRVTAAILFCAGRILAFCKNSC